MQNHSHTPTHASLAPEELLSEIRKKYLQYFREGLLQGLSDQLKDLQAFEYERDQEEWSFLEGIRKNFSWLRWFSFDYHDNDFSLTLFLTDICEKLGINFDDITVDNIEAQLKNDFKWIALSFLQEDKVCVYHAMFHARHIIKEMYDTNGWCTITDEDIRKIITNMLEDENFKTEIMNNISYIIVFLRNIIETQQVSDNAMSILEKTV